MFISHFKSLSGKARHQGLPTHDREDSFTTLLVLLACGKTTLLRMIAGLDVLGEVKQMGADACLLLWMVQNAITPHKSDSLVGSNDKRMTLTPLSSSCVGSDSRRVISPSFTTPNFSVRRRMMPSPSSKAASFLALPAPSSAPYGDAHRASYAKTRKERQDPRSRKSSPGNAPGIVLVIMLFGSDIYSLLPLYNTMAILVITYVILFLPYTAEYVISA